VTIEPSSGTAAVEAARDEGGGRHDTAGRHSTHLGNAPPTASSAFTNRDEKERTTVTGIEHLRQRAATPSPPTHCRSARGSPYSPPFTTSATTNSTDALVIVLFTDTPKVYDACSRRKVPASVLSVVLESNTSEC
jgi:hypothetical protein